MNIAKTLTAGIVGTTMMTLFSYVTSEKKNKQFREPVLLHKLVNRLLHSKKTSTLDGWIIHYLVGISFAASYDLLWKKTSMTPTIKNGLLLGGISGLIGVGFWKKTFDLHPNPPKTDYKKRYYFHLLVAHLVFGAFATLGYRLPNASENGMHPTQRIED